MRRFLSTVLAVSVAGCGRSTAPTQPTPDISGNWSGTITSAAAGTGTISFTLSQVCLVLLPPGSGCEDALSGSWSASFASSASDESGALGGEIGQSAVLLDLAQSTSATCPLNVSATMTGSTSMRGTFASARPGGTGFCPAADSGTFSATKQ